MDQIDKLPRVEGVVGVGCRAPCSAHHEHPEQLAIKVEPGPETKGTGTAHLNGPPILVLNVQPFAKAMITRRPRNIPRRAIISMKWL